RPTSIVSESRSGRMAEPRRCNSPKVRMLLELLDLAGRIHALVHDAASACKSIHAGDDRQDPVSLEWCLLERSVQSRDLRPGDLVGPGSSKFRLDELVQQIGSSCCARAASGHAAARRFTARCLPCFRPKG